MSFESSWDYFIEFHENRKVNLIETAIVIGGHEVPSFSAIIRLDWLTDRPTNRSLDRSLARSLACSFARNRTSPRRSCFADASIFMYTRKSLATALSRLCHIRGAGTCVSNMYTPYPFPTCLCYFLVIFRPFSPRHHVRHSRSLISYD